ncbi:MAG: hypothetical protein V3T30_04510, partial [Thermodesulfobacteriota bacterium]
MARKNKKKKRSTKKNIEVVEEQRPLITEPRREPVSRWLYPVLVALIVIITFLVFLPTLDNFFLIWDDNALIVGNQDVRALDMNLLKKAFFDVAMISWYPITILSIALDYAIWGGYEPWGFHLTSNIFHSLNALLVFILITRLAGYVWKSDDGTVKREALVAGFVTAILFALHPLRVESVAWATQRKDMLYAFFYLLGLVTYLSYVTKERARKYYLLTIFFFIGSIFSKAMAISFPIVLLILDYYPLGRLSFKAGKGEPLKRLLVEKIPFFALSFFGMLVGLLTHKATGTLTEHSLIVRILVSFRGYAFYLYKTLWPASLSPYYPYPSKLSLFSLEGMAPVLIFIAISAVSLYLIKRSRLYIALWVYYLITLLPVIGIVQAWGASAADHYTYLSGLAPLLLFGLLAGLTFREGSKKALRGLAIAVFLIASVLFARKTLLQIPIWKDTITVWSQAIDLNPG